MGVSCRRVLSVAAFVLSLAPSAGARCKSSTETGDATIRLKVCLDGDKPVGVSMKTEWTHGWVWVGADALASRGYTLTATGLSNESGHHAFEPFRPTLPAFAAADVESVYIIRRAEEYLRRGPNPGSGCADAYRYGQELVSFFRTNVPLTVCFSADGYPTGVSYAEGESWGWLDARTVGNYGWQLTEAGLVDFGGAGGIILRYFSTNAKRDRANDGNLTIEAIVRDEAAKRRAREAAQAAMSRSF